MSTLETSSALDVPGFHARRPADNQRNVQSLVVEKLLAARQGHAMVGRNDNRRVVVDPFAFEPGDDFAHQPVGILRTLQAHGPVFASQRRVGIPGRQDDAGRIDGPGRIAVPWPMRADQRQVGEERLARLALLPVVAQVDLGGRELEVQVDLLRVAAAQGGEIVGVAEQLRQRLHPRGQRLLVGGAMLFGMYAVLAHAGHQRGSTRRTDRCAGKACIITAAFGRQSVEIGRMHHLLTIAAQIRSPIFQDNEQHVRLRVAGGQFPGERVSPRQHDGNENYGNSAFAKGTHRRSSGVWISFCAADRLEARDGMAPQAKTLVYNLFPAHCDPHGVLGVTKSASSRCFGPDAEGRAINHAACRDRGG